MEWIEERSGKDAAGSWDARVPGAWAVPPDHMVGRPGNDYCDTIINDDTPIHWDNDNYPPHNPLPQEMDTLNEMWEGLSHATATGVASKDGLNSLTASVI